MTTQRKKKIIRKVIEPSTIEEKKHSMPSTALSILVFLLFFSFCVHKAHRFYLFLREEEAQKIRSQEYKERKQLAVEQEKAQQGKF